MAIENAGQPSTPKKKLKQAQLPFCVVTPKANKRKLSNATDDPAEVPVKVLCQQAASNPLKHVLTEKEHNLDETPADQVVSAAHEPNNDFDKRSNVGGTDPEIEGGTIKQGSIEAEESEMNVTGLSDAQNSGGDRSLDCSLLLVISTSESEVEDEVHSSGSAIVSQQGKEAISGDVAVPKKQKKKSERSAERERIRKEKELKRVRQKEEKLRLKQEKENARKKEKEDKEQKRLADIRAKEEEKKKKEEAKEEARKQKEQEKKKKEEAKEEEKRKKGQEKLAIERKEHLAKEAFSKFFKRARGSEAESGKSQPEKQFVQKFMPFAVKHDMKMAVVHRVELSQEAKDRLTSLLETSEGDTSSLYLEELKNGVRKPGKSEATWPSSDEVHDVIIIESVKDENEVEKTLETPVKKKQSFRAKLFQFQENRRPPYWGTWRKNSDSVSSRKPFEKEKTLDYEVDSDLEWEDEGEGEDLEKENDSDNEKEQSDDENVGENGYLIDNSVFVPHGYLSDEEAEDEDNCDPESQKLRMTALKREFDEEMKQSTNRLQPKVLGCVWISNETTEVSKGSFYQVLMNHRCIWNEEDGPIDLSGPVVEDTPPTPLTVQKTKFPESMIEPLVKMVHGSQMSHIALVKEFMSYLEQEEVSVTASKRAVSHKIKDIAVKTSTANGPAWQVSADLCAKFGLPFVIEKKAEEVPAVNPEPVTPRGVAPLTKFFKKIPAEAPLKSPLTKYPEIKKRVLLISLTRLEDEERIKKSVPGESTPLPFLDCGIPVESEKANQDKSRDDPAPDGLVPDMSNSTPAPAPPLPAPTSTTPKQKKRITPITLSRTPTTPIDQQNAKVHDDTPRPIHAFFKTFQKD